MLGLLGISKVQAIIAAVVVGAAATVVTVFWLQNRSLTKDLATTRQNLTVATTVLEQQRASTQAARANAQEWRDALLEYQSTIEKMAAVEAVAAQEVRRLNDLFTEHDLAALAVARPGLIQRRINSGSADALGVLYDITSGGGRGPPGAGDARQADPPAAAADNP